MFTNCTGKFLNYFCCLVLGFDFLNNFGVVFLDPLPDIFSFLTGYNDSFAASIQPSNTELLIFFNAPFCILCLHLWIMCDIGIDVHGFLEFQRADFWSRFGLVMRHTLKGSIWRVSFGLKVGKLGQMEP